MESGPEQIVIHGVHILNRIAISFLFFHFEKQLRKDQELTIIIQVEKAHLSFCLVGVAFKSQ